MPVSDFSPSVEDLGALMRTRTQENGTETGTFGTETRPTADEALGAIRTAADDLAISIGENIPVACFNAAKTLVKYRAAMLIELGFFAEQVREGASMYEAWKELYDEGLQGLINRIQSTEAEGDDTTLSAGMAEFAFPRITVMEW